MPSRTKTGLNLADRNSYVRVEENINDNLLKIDDDVDATWGGLYGGYIQDETITKEIGKRYIDEFNKKAYICRKLSNVNTEDAYTECNVVDNLNKLKGMSTFRQFNTAFYKGISIDIVYNDSLMWISFEGNPSEDIFNPGVIYTLPNNMKPIAESEPMSKYLAPDKSISFRINKSGQISMHITSIQTGQNISFSPADNRAIRAYCCVPYGY